MNLNDVWDWLHVQDNRDTAAWFGGLGLALLAGAKHLVRKRDDNPPPKGQRETYLRLMADKWRVLPLDVLDPNAADPASRRLSLENVYVSLDTTSLRPERLKQDTPQEQREGPLSAVEALLVEEGRAIVLLGQPGSGKSTFGRYLCLELADALLKPGEVSLAERLPGWRGSALLPVFVPLRQFADVGAADKKPLLALIRQQAEDGEDLQGYGPVLLEELQDKGGVVVFDGLDEVAAQWRSTVKQALQGFAKNYPLCRVLATCRVYSYRQDAAWQLPWADHTLAEFDQDQIQRFIGGWYGALAQLNPSSPVNYLAKAQTLKAVLGYDDPRDLLRLAGTPLLLTVMAIVHAYKELPDSRVGVYRECVDILLMRWQAAREDKDAKRPPLLTALAAHGVTAQKLHQGLREIAHTAHQSGDARSGSGNRALVSDVTINGVMLPWLGAEGLQIFQDYCRHDNGLLLTERVVARGEGVAKALYVFPHLSFEEYLAALHMFQQQGSGIEEAAQRAGDPAWWEVSRFYGEYLCHDEQSANRHLAKALLEELCPPLPGGEGSGDADWRRIWLAGALLPGWRKEFPQQGQNGLADHITARLVDLLQTATALRDDPPARAAAGRALAEIGDPRPGVGLAADGLPGFLWARIPGTACVLASGLFPRFDGLRLGLGAKPDPQAFGNENWPQDKEALELVDFELAAYPVTVAQFRPFVEQGGYRDDTLWSEAGRCARDAEGWAAPAYWEDRRWNLPNHPVVGVSWFEAQAYCRWLNRHLPETQAVRLPTEAEWEWAARGPQGWIYPWGDGFESWRCNGDESGIGRTSAVGGFPAGAACWWLEILADGCAVHDLVGNVWEWTGSAYSEDYALAMSAIDSEAGGPRVLRGGSWFTNARTLRPALRLGFDPHDRFRSRGFRLARTLSL